MRFGGITVLQMYVERSYHLQVFIRCLIHTKLLESNRVDLRLADTYFTCRFHMAKNSDLLKLHFKNMYRIWEITITYQEERDHPL